MKMLIRGIVGALAAGTLIFLFGCKKEDAEQPLGQMTRKNLPLEKVDMNLPSGTLWANYNLGATAPDEVGDYFAWGEIEPKSYYDWSNYRFGEQYALTKYVYYNQHFDIVFGKDGYTDDLGVLQKEDDAAAQIWKDNWCTPSTADFKELFENCNVSWEQYEEDGLVWGLRFRRKNDPDRTLFIPASGSRYISTQYLNVWAQCWTSSFDVDNNKSGTPFSADYFGTNSYYLSYYVKDKLAYYSPYRNGGRNVGRPIRPCYKPQ